MWLHEVTTECAVVHTSIWIQLKSLRFLWAHVSIFLKNQINMNNTVVDFLNVTSDPTCLVLYLQSQSTHWNIVLLYEGCVCVCVYCLHIHGHIALE